MHIRGVAMRLILILIASLAFASQASAFSYATGGCATGGCAEGENWLHTNANEIDAAIDSLEAAVAAVEAFFTGSDANTALALAANGGNCSAGSYPLGVNASGAVESCTDATTEIDAAVNAKSAASAGADGDVMRADGTSGDVQDSGCNIDDSGNLTCEGDATFGTSGASCLILRDSDDGGDSACEVLNGTFSCETDTNGVCGDAT